MSSACGFRPVLCVRVTPQALGERNTFSLRVYTCLFRFGRHRFNKPRPNAWSNSLTRKGVLQISLPVNNLVGSKRRPQRIFKVTEAHTLAQPSDRGDCLFRGEIHSRSCDWSNFLTREGAFQIILQASHLATREERK